MDNEIKVIDLMVNKVVVVIDYYGNTTTYQNQEDKTYYLLEVPSSISKKDIPIDEIKLVAKNANDRVHMVIKSYLIHLFTTYPIEILRVYPKHFARQATKFSGFNIYAEQVKELMGKNWTLQYLNPGRIKHPIGFKADGEVIYEYLNQRHYLLRKQMFV